MNQIIELEQSDDLIIGLSYTIQRLVVNHLHVVGDIYDRGPQPDKIMDTLIDYHSVDIQWVIMTYYGLVPMPVQRCV